MGIRLSGRVSSPLRSVCLFARHEASGQPATVAAKGWVKVGRYRTSDDGKFLSALLRPGPTTWYVARYPRPSDEVPSYFFTPVVRVSVR